ncbi:coiled-coil domain-containing protein 152 isoform X1 [Neopelma chrysocephalum]|uniref:coiled-coil domain-containing protein 152 isoform X1 n=1 Tax=Neopelma chrysocephalum TaxID=114329 RepID=UPI000FCD3C55|nr:coiled-coil domain-containing protein 152 isoform X1 [Neopelma chrysocephalum]
MNHSDEETMKKNSVVNLDKLLDDFSEIEKKISEINEANNLLIHQLEKCNRLLTLSQSKEESVKEEPTQPVPESFFLRVGPKATEIAYSRGAERKSAVEGKTVVPPILKECTTLQNVISGLTQTIENQCNVKDENDRLKDTIHTLEDKLKACEEEYKDQIEKLMTEIKNKEEDHKLEITQLNCNIRKKFEVKEMEYREEREKKELEILELTRQLKIQNEEKQNEIIKLQIEFNAKLARAQDKTTKSFSDASVLPQSIYRRKLQHLQEEKNKEIEFLRNTIRDLEQRLHKGQDLHLKRKRF